jgi:Flp pilus assembly protein TadG
MLTLGSLLGAKALLRAKSRSGVKSFLNSRNGLAAVEFAMIAPVMLLLFFGLIELSNGVECRERVETTSASTADLIAQRTYISNADRDNVFAASAATLYPFASNPQIVITSLTYNTPSTGVVAWSDGLNTAPLAVGSSVNVPAGVISSGGSVIMAKVSYTYHSGTTYVVTGPVTMQSTFYSRPRRSVTVARVP